MKRKNTNLDQFMDEKSVSPILEVCYALNNLKSLYRQGWLRKGLPAGKCESVADHIFGVVALVMVIVDSFQIKFDMVKLFRMAVIHDLAEIYAGDITPYDCISREEKFNIEKDSIIRLFKPLHLEAEYGKLWEEYEMGFSPESRFIQQIDKLEMVIQANAYEYQESIDLEEFFTSTRGLFDDPVFKDIFSEIESMRKKTS